ncbi:hypothetical protein D3C85_1559080 [compost metagenome]
MVRTQQHALAQDAEQQLVEIIGVGQHTEQEYQPVGLIGVVPADECITEQAADKQVIG